MIPVAPVVAPVMTPTGQMCSFPTEGIAVKPREEEYDELTEFMVDFDKDFDEEEVIFTQQG